MSSARSMLTCGFNSDGLTTAAQPAAIALAYIHTHIVSFSMGYELFRTAADGTGRTRGPRVRKRGMLNAEMMRTTPLGSALSFGPIA